jgi:serine/threonine protein kinase
MPAITTPDTFLDLLRRSGAIDPRRLDVFLANKYGGQTPGDPNKIADDLIDAGLLTKYHTEPLLAGRQQRFTLSGKYRMIDRLGSGGMASVFLCEHRVMRRRVAVKMLPPSVASNASALDRFHREARAMAGVHHPNIVGAHDVDQDGKIHFIVMEYVDGTNFHELIRRVGPLPVDRAAHYTAQAAKGLQHAHDKGLVHRDIKPANLLLDRTGLVKILDLGLALVFQSNDDNLTRDHDANSILGTAEYLAPEQAVDSHNVDHRADIYSLGMTLYFILTAQTPFGEGTTAQKLIWHQLRQPKPVRDHRPDVSEELWAVLSKMLAKDPKDRYQTMTEVAEAMAPWTGTPIPPPADREMPKPLADLSADGPMGDYSSSTSYPSAASLPSPLEPAPTDRNGRPAASSSLSPPPIPEVNFAMPGGMESATTNTLPVSAAPTDPKKPASSVGGPARPVVAVVAPPPSVAPASSPAKSKPPAVAAVSPASTPKQTPAPSSAGAKRASNVSGVMQKSVAVSVSDDDDDAKTSKPKSKKFKKKQEKKSNTVLYAAVGGGGVALFAVIGLALMLSGDKSKQEDNLGTPGGTPSTPGGGGAVLEPPPTPKKIETGPFKEFDGALVNVVANGRVLATTSQANGKDPPHAAFDNDYATKWVGAAKGPWWVQYEFPAGVSQEVVQYGVVSADYTIAANKGRDRDPKSWKLEGSQDGSHFDSPPLDERKDQTFDGPKQLKVYAIPKPGRYQYYRLTVTDNSGSKDRVMIAEVPLRSPSLGSYLPPPVTSDPVQPTETLPEPRSPGTMTTPSAPVVPQVTADFFPTTSPQPKFYTMTWKNLRLPALRVVPPPGGTRVWAVGTQKWVFEEPAKPADPKAPKTVGTDVSLQLVEVGWASSPAGNITGTKQFGTGAQFAKIGVKIEDGKAQLLWPDPVTTLPVWNPVLEIGAKKGDKWSVQTPLGDAQTYTLTDLDVKNGRPTATVRTERLIPAKNLIEQTTYEFAKGVGMTLRSVDRVAVKPAAGVKKGGDPEPDEELRIKFGQ